MSNDRKKTPYPLRMTDEVKEWITKRAKDNDRTVHAELSRILREVKEAEEQKETKDA